MRQIVPALLLLGLCQTIPAQQQAQGQQPLPEQLQPRVYVRRVSAAATLTVPVLSQFVTGYDYFVQTTPPLESAVESTSKRHWGGGGLTLQFALTERVALTMNALFRKAEFKSIRDDLTGVDNPNTLIDDRIRTTTEDWTRVRFLDVPVLARIYTRRRHEPGDRWFFQAGVNNRSVRRLANNTTITDQKGNKYETTTALPPYTRRVSGLTVGFGAQLIDPVGVRVIPEFRYTRWFGSNFNLFGTQSRRDHIEIMFSLGF